MCETGQNIYGLFQSVFNKLKHNSSMKLLANERPLRERHNLLSLNFWIYCNPRFIETSFTRFTCAAVRALATVELY
jgi:hypothetical protein